MRKNSGEKRRHIYKFQTGAILPSAVNSQQAAERNKGKSKKIKMNA